MKYIRIEEGVYELKVNEDWKKRGTVNYFYIDVGNHLSYTFEKKDLKKYKQADTIEKLCDEFVVAYENDARIVYCDLEWAKTKAKSSLEIGNKSIIYGAIWTNKGLVYVAKMNEKGEFELL